MLLFPGFASNQFAGIVFSHHLGAGYLLAYLKERGIRAGQFLCEEPMDLDGLTDKVLNRNPRMVGFTCYDTNYYIIKLVSGMLKQKNPDLPIVVGGPTATFSDELIMQDHSALDVCVRGEGEATLHELIGKLGPGLDVSDVDGITYREDSRAVRTPDRSFLQGERGDRALDVLPSPYLNGTLPADEKLGILTSRGCVFRCTYCNFSAMSRWTIRYHSVERVIDELKIISKGLQGRDARDLKPLSIYDDTFSMNLQRAKQICRRIIEEKIAVPLWADLRADRIDRELLALMKEAGVQRVNVGLESAVPRVLHTVKKVRDHTGAEDDLGPEIRFVQRVKESVGLAREVGLEVSVSVILGLPGAALEDDRQTLDFVRKLEVEEYSHNYLRVFSGTELSGNYKKYGLQTRQPLMVLPRRTVYTHDVYKIPMMNNAMQSRFAGEYLERTLAMVTGEYGGSPVESYPDLFLRDEDLLRDETIRWLSGLVTLASRMLILGDRGLEHFASRNMERMILQGMPVTNFSLAELLPVQGEASRDPGPGGAGTEPPELEPGLREGKALKWRDPDFGILDHYGLIRLELESMDVRVGRKILFALSTRDEMKKLSRLVSPSGRVVLESCFAQHDCYFVDACRWLSHECPAVGFRRALVHREGAVMPCFRGTPIGAIGESREEIRKKLGDFMLDRKQKRGCDTCSAEARCAKCLFPHPVEEDEYCMIMRGEHPDLCGVETLFRLLGILRLIRRRFEGTAQGLKADHIEGTIDESSLSVVDMGENRYLYHHGSDRLFRGGRP
ncbi:B12-binding domain-containing radical SAM protein [Thermodesulfobacteriota bacterium]